MILVAEIHDALQHIETDQDRPHVGGVFVGMGLGCVSGAG